MPRFFFHVHDGADIIDEEGTECADWEHAQQEALRVAGTIIADNAKRKNLGEVWSMKVTDHNDLILFQLDFVVTAAPVILAMKRK